MSSIIVKSSHIDVNSTANCAQLLVSVIAPCSSMIPDMVVVQVTVRG